MNHLFSLLLLGLLQFTGLFFSILTTESITSWNLSNMDILCIVEPNPPIMIFEKFSFHTKDFEASYFLDIVAELEALFLNIFLISVVLEQIIVWILAFVIIVNFFVFFAFLGITFIDWCQKLHEYGYTTSCLGLTASLNYFNGLAQLSTVFHVIKQVHKLPFVEHLNFFTLSKPYKSSIVKELWFLAIARITLVQSRIVVSRNTVESFLFLRLIFLGTHHSRLILGGNCLICRI